jgi:hypothetical protein
MSDTELPKGVHEDWDGSFFVYDTDLVPEGWETTGREFEAEDCWPLYFISQKERK